MSAWGRRAACVITLWVAWSSLLPSPLPFASSAEAARRVRKKRKQKQPLPPPPAPAPHEYRDVEETYQTAPPPPSSEPISPSLPAAEEGEIVESIEDDSESPLPPADAPLAPPVDRAGSVGFTGWARGFGNVSTGGPLTPGALQVPYDRATARGQLQLRLRYTRLDRFEAVLSGLLHSATYLDAQKPDWEWRGESTVELREAYVGLFFNRVDLRVGEQRVAWGRSDAFGPNDVLNPRDLRDPLLAETELLYVPMFMARVDVALPHGNLQGVVQPFFAPDRFDLYGNNWALVQADAPALWRGLLNFASALGDPRLDRAVQPLRDAGGRQILGDISRPAGGLRYSWTLEPFDLAHTYYVGPTRQPSLTVDPAFAQQMEALVGTTLPPEQLEGLLQALDAGLSPVSFRFPVRHHLGTDVQTSVGPFVLRGDVAYDSASVSFAEDLTGRVRPSFQMVVGGEYQFGELGKLVLVEAWYQRLLGAPIEGRLLFGARNALALAGKVGWIFFDELFVELRSVWGVNPRGMIVRPQVAWKRGALELRLGGLALNGEALSTADYYRHNRGLYGAAKLHF